MTFKDRSDKTNMVPVEDMFRYRATKISLSCVKTKYLNIPNYKGILKVSFVSAIYFFQNWPKRYFMQNNCYVCSDFVSDLYIVLFVTTIYLLLFI